MVKVWDVVTGECVATLEGHSEGVFCVAVFPNGRRVVSGSRDNTLKVWDVATGECVAMLEGHTGIGVRCCVRFLWYSFVICFRCRSIALPCFRTGGASFLGRA